MEHHNTTKHFFDLLSIGGVMATLAGWLPAIAAFFSLVWTIFRLIEMLTGKAMHKHINEWKKK